MTPVRAGEICDRLDKSLRGSEFNLSAVANTIVLVIREEAWRARVVRTGEVVECESFLEMLTAPPLRGFGEDPERVEALLQDDAEALRMFREAITAPHGGNRRDRPHKTDIVRVEHHGSSRAYTLTRLHAQHPALYERVVAGELSAHAAAIQAGLRRQRTPLEQLRHWWRRASAAERDAFEADREGTDGHSSQSGQRRR